MHNNADGVSHAAAGLERVGRDAAHVGQKSHDCAEVVGQVEGNRVGDCRRDHHKVVAAPPDVRGDVRRDAGLRVDGEDLGLPL